MNNILEAASAAAGAALVRDAGWVNPLGDGRIRATGDFNPTAIARAVIEAIRETTSEMVDEGARHRRAINLCAEDAVEQGTRAMWEAMINYVLNGPDKQRLLLRALRDANSELRAGPLTEETAQELIRVLKMQMNA